LKLFKRILIGTASLLFGLILFLIVSILFDYAIGGDRIQKIANTTIPAEPGQPDIYAFTAKPDGEGPFPTVIMIHEFFGLNDNIVGKAEGLAEEGYYVVAPDTFRGSTTAWIPRAIYQVISTDPERVNIDLDSVFTWIEGQPDVDPDRIAIAGFCYGGRASLTYSLHNPNIAATIVFYGSPETDPAVLTALNGPVLGIFGGADNSIPLSDVHAFEISLTQSGIQNEITIYPDQPHAFVTDIETIRKGGVQGQAWEQFVDFLDTHLKNNPGSSGSIFPTNQKPSHDWGYYLRLTLAHIFNTSGHAH
jgi:carboxymethylenebutenolidase